jgi:hypothetical protein
MLAPITPPMDFRPAYGQIDQWERKFVDGYVKDIEGIAEKTGQRLLAVLQQPFPWELDQRAVAMLARPMVRAAIAERVKELSELYDISIMRTLKANAVIAYSNISNYVKINEWGEPEPDFANCTPEMMEAVKSIEIEEKPRGGKKIKFTLHDKLAALGNMMRYQGLLTDGNAHWLKQEQSVQPTQATMLPKDIDEDAAAALYAREIGG